MIATETQGPSNVPQHVGQGFSSCCNHQQLQKLRLVYANAAAVAAGPASASWRRRDAVKVQAVAATERPANKVTGQVYELPKGSRISVGHLWALGDCWEGMGWGQLSSQFNRFTPANGTARRNVRMHLAGSSRATNRCCHRP
jgi:hypothetical protein